MLSRWLRVVVLKSNEELGHVITSVDLLNLRNIKFNSSQLIQFLKQQKKNPAKLKYYITIIIEVHTGNKLEFLNSIWFFQVLGNPR